MGRRESFTPVETGYLTPNIFMEGQSNFLPTGANLRVVVRNGVVQESGEALESIVKPDLQLVADEGQSLQGNMVQFPQDFSIGLEDTDFASANSFTNDLKEIQQDWIQEEGEWYLLPGTGFDVKREVDRLCENVLRGLGDGDVLDFDALLQRSFLEVTGNIWGFVLEYLEERPVLPFMHTIVTDAEGNMRLRPVGYDGFLRDAITEEERYGAVRRSIIDIEDKKLPIVKVGDTLVRTSPLGWSNIPGKKYKDTQTQFMEIVTEEGETKVKGYTIRTKMDVAQNILFLQSIGADTNLFSQTDEYEQLAAISEAVVHVPGGSGAGTLELVEKIQEVFGELAYGEYTFEDVRRDMVERFSELFNVNPLTNQQAEQFASYGTQEFQEAFLEMMITGEVPEQTKRNFQKALGTTILRLWNTIKRLKKGEVTTEESTADLEDIMRGKKQLDFDPRAARAEVAELPGCNGGGAESSGMTKDYLVILIPGGAIIMCADGTMYTIEGSKICKVCKFELPCGPCQICLECDVKARESGGLLLAA